MLRRRGRTWQSCRGERAKTAVGYITLIFHTPIWQACPKLLTGFLLKDTLSRHMVEAQAGDTQLKFNRRKLIYACDILTNVSFYLQPFFEKQRQFSTSGWQTIAGAADELQATTEYGFPPVYIAVSNKCLLAVKCSGAVAKYIPQGSSTKTVLAIKGKKDRGETVEAASHH